MLPLSQWVHLGGPHCLDAQLVASIRQKPDSAQQSLGPRVYFWGGASTNRTLAALRSPATATRIEIVSLHSPGGGAGFRKQRSQHPAK
jgi:hypothetical protein